MGGLGRRVAAARAEEATVGETGEEPQVVAMAEGVMVTVATVAARGGAARAAAKAAATAWAARAAAQVRARRR